jgi:hypothetical protein
MNIEQPQPGQRPTLLTVLCVLSFIGSGMGAVSNLFVYLVHPTLITLIESGAYDEMGFDLGFFSSIEQSYFLLSGLLQVVSFTGVVHMWKLRRSGFHLYAISQLLMLILSSVYVYKPLGTYPMFDLMFAALFILMYLRFRPIMN